MIFQMGDDTNWCWEIVDIASNPTQHLWLEIHYLWSGKNPHQRYPPCGPAPLVFAPTAQHPRKEMAPRSSPPILISFSHSNVEEKPGFSAIFWTIWSLPVNLPVEFEEPNKKRMEVLEDPGKCGDVRKMACAPLANTQITTQIGVPPNHPKFPVLNGDETNGLVGPDPQAQQSHTICYLFWIGKSMSSFHPKSHVHTSTPFPSPRKQSSHCCERSNLLLSLSRANGPHLRTAQVAVIESTGWCGLIPRDYPSKPGHGKIV